MNVVTSKRLGEALTLLAVLLALGNVGWFAVLELDASYESPASVGSFFDILMALAFCLVGGLIAVKRPENLVGGAMMLAGLGILGGGIFSGYAEVALLAKPEAGLPAGEAAAALSAGSWTPLMAGVFLLVLLFPSGRVPSQRWGVVARLVLVSFAIIWAAIATGPEFDPPYENFENPLDIGIGNFVLLIFPIIAFCLLSIAAAVVNLVLRFRRSRGDEREQYKWLALSAGMLVLAMPFSGFAGLGLLSQISNVMFVIGLVGLPISVGIAVLRYRLYDIDRILNRTLVYALLTAGLAGLYFGLVVAMQEAFRPISGSSDLSIALTTLIVAALFLPARQRVQALVDRRFNRRVYDTARTLDAFGARLRQNIDLDTLRYELLTVVDETMEPSRVSLWLRPQEASG